MARFGTLCALPALLAAIPAGEARALLPVGEPVELARRLWMPALLGEDNGARFGALAEMRAYPELARQSLLLALSAGSRNRRRWRLAYRLAEFGHADDIPVLLSRLEEEKDPFTLKVIAGAVRALYPVHDPESDPMPDLALAVEEFFFLQTESPQPYGTNRENTAALAGDVFRAYYATGMPQRAIDRLLPLRNKRFPDVAALAEAVEKALGTRLWKRYGEAALKPVVPVPPRAAAAGVLRVRVRNPSERSLLVQIDYDAWFGRFDSAPGPALLYVPAGESARHDRPVRIIGPAGEFPVRVDLGLREVHQRPARLFRKLYITLLP